MSDPDDFDRFDLDTIGRAERYKLLTGAVTPRPIALVGSAMPDGRTNLAPFSQFIILCVDPGLLGFSVGPASGRTKDTLVNIERTGEFVINIVPDDMAEIIQACSSDFPPEVSEADHLRLELVASQTITVPRVARANIQFECRLETITSFGDAPNRLVAGRVTHMHVKAGMSEGHKIDPLLHRPLGRVGGRNYVRFGEIISL